MFISGFACRVECAVCDHCFFCHRGCLGNLVVDGDLLLQEVGLRPNPCCIQVSQPSVCSRRLKIQTHCPSSSSAEPWDVGFSHLSVSS